MKPRKSLLVLVALLCLAVVPGRSADIAELKRQVAGIGRLEFKRDVPVRYLDRGQLRAYVERLFAEDYPADLAARESEYLYWMGFTRERVDLRDLRRRIILENVGGMYNEKTDELLAVEEFRQVDMLNAPALAHELRHALQDQHFDLAAVLGDLSDFDDRKLAALAAVEGDATLVMVKQMGFDPDQVGDAFSPENILSFSALAGATTLAAAPEVVRLQLLMPYLDGMRFSRAVVREGGWKALNRVLARKPLSSEQVLHPDKYAAGERPLDAAIRFRPGRGERFHSGVVGEYYLNVLLKQGDETADAARGWGGDAFALYRDGQERLLLWQSRWDSAADAARFHAEFRRFLERAFRVNFREGSGPGRAFLAGSSDAGYFFLCRDNDRLFYARGSDRHAINELISGGIYD
jgi:hypothetical protein